MSEQPKLLKRDWPYMLMAFLWPFVYLIRYLVPDTAYSLKIGVDVIYFHFPKVYLLDALSNFRLPLWSPVEAAGFPFFSSPFNQVFYPLNFPLALYYKIMGGFSWADYQRLSIFGVALFAVFLFKWLRYLRISPSAALFSTMVVSVSFKMLTTLNRVPATHSSAWMMLMLLALTMMVHSRKRIKGTLLLFLGTLMLLFGAYPYYIYYSIFLFPPFVLMLLLPKTREAFTGVKDLNIAKYLGAIFLAIIPPALLAAPYLYKLSQLQGQVINRDASDVEYALEAPFGFFDTLSALFIPCFSDTRGWYYFGFISLLMIVLYIINHFYTISREKEDKKLFYYSIGFIAFISLTTYANFVLFKLFWAVLPGFSNLRTWGRLNIILLPFLAILLAKGFHFLINILLNEEYRSDDFKEKMGKFLGIFAGVYAFILGIQLYLNNVETLIPNWKKKLMDVEEYSSSFAPSLYIYAGILSFILLSGLLLIRWKSDFFKANKKLLSYSIPIILLFLNSYDVGLTAIKIRSYPESPTSFRKVVNVEQMNEMYFNTKRAFNLFLSRIYTPTPLSVLHGKKWYYSRYTDFVVAQGGTYGDDFKNEDLRNKVKSNKERPASLDQFLGVTDGKKLYFTKNNSYLETEKFIEDATNDEQVSNFNHKVKFYNGDYLKLMVQTDSDGYLHFVDNWDADWHAKINGETVEIEKLFKTFKSIKIPKGSHQVQFFYNPFPFSLFRSFPPFDTPESIALEEKKQKHLQQLDDLSNSLHLNSNITWTDQVGVRVKKDTLLAMKEGDGKSGLAANNRLKANENGAVEWKVTEQNKHRVLGLSPENKNAKIRSIQYGFYLTAKGYLTIQEKGRYKGTFGRYNKNDQLRIERIDQRIHYRKNGELIYTSDILSDTDLLIDISFLNKGAFFTNIQSTF